MVAVSRGHFAGVGGLTARADYGIGPALGFKKVDGGLFVRDEFKEDKNAGKFSVWVGNFVSHDYAKTETAPSAGFLS